VTNQDTLLWPEEVAEKLGLDRSSTPRSYANWSARKLRRMRESDPGAQLGPADFPLPHDHAKRTVTTRGGHERTAVSPRWLASAIDTYLANRRGPGGRPMSKP
jgi:hypothetical protein